MDRKKFYITTPIYYVNAPPHIGHAYTNVISDVIARFKRLSGLDVKFLTGTDEHGQKVEKAALAAGVDTLDFVTKTAKNFEDLAQHCNISNDDFIRTTQKRHTDLACRFWEQLKDAGDIYLGSYAGWYSTRDEAFYSEGEIKDGLAPTGSPVEWVKEDSYFFRLSKFQDRLLEFYQQNPSFIMPAYRMNEVRKFVEGGLQDLSISRTSFSWGIKVPNDPAHVMYVWLDALVNYQSALGNKEKDFWPANLHVVGKDILRFHAVYWPAFLMSAKMPLPRCILAHGWWTNQGEKISKSLGNVIDPLKITNSYGSDAMRFFLVREITLGSDGNFSEENLISRFNSELANKVGNLLQRVMSFAHKNFEGRVPNIEDELLQNLDQNDLMKKVVSVGTSAQKLIENYAINEILGNIIETAQSANIYVEETKPWVLIKEDKNKAACEIYLLLEVLRRLAINLQPFIPESASAMLDQLSVASGQRDFKYLSSDYAMKPGATLQKPVPIFKQIEVDK